MTTKPLRPTLWIEQGQVFTWDQTRLPFEREVICLANSQDCARAIASMQVRGAPLIGAVAALGMAMAIREALAKHPGCYREAGWLDTLAKALLATRPTAVNLAWAVAQVSASVNAILQASTIDQEPPTQDLRGDQVNDSLLNRESKPTADSMATLLAEQAWQRALDLVDEDRSCNAAIGMQTQNVLMNNALMKHAHGHTASRPLQILTHCNAGALATVDWGTATAGIYQLHAQGIALHVWVDETRPRNQGASLTAYELADAGIPHTVIADNAGGLLMMRGLVDAVMVGCDRVCANGDVVNKIGTYLKALAAKAHGIPFWVACPASSIDMNCPSGMDVSIEERSALELSQIRGLPVHPQQSLRQPILVEIMQAGQTCYNPGFDITPAALVSGLITEHALINPLKLREAFA
ncbi:MAG: S-methyl-5-thioribose-1-phosphate isomerase [Betaproteobacteria bacterium]